MRSCLVAAALLGAVAGARVRTVPDDGVALKAPADLFDKDRKSVSFAPPGGKHFDLDVEVTTGNAQSQTDSVASMSGGDGNAQMTAVLQQDGHMAGSLVDPEDGKVYQFLGKIGEEVKFITTDSSGFPEELDPLDEEHAESDAINAEGNLSAGETLNVLVVWTKEAECLNAGLSSGCSLTSSTQSSMRAKINLAVRETNDAYDFSRINTQLRLVHAYRHPDYTEKGFSNDLNNLRGTSDGNMDDVHSLRDQYRAHFVALINGDRQYCGLAYVGPNKNYMFSVTSQGCATGYYSFGHEIGHNMGCLHDRDVGNNCGRSGFNYGYRDPAAQWRDTLSYGCRVGCLGQAANGRCTRMKFYSNPNVNYNGKPTGLVDTADLARTINNVKGTVASYY